MRATTIPITSITVNYARKFRATDDESVVDDYAALYKAGADMPRLDVFRLGDESPATYILANGDKRFRALIRLKYDDVPVIVHEGGDRDALLFAAKANYINGVRPSPADKRKTVKFFLDDEEWGDRSDKWIADAAGVSNHLVAELRAEREDAKAAEAQAAGQPAPVEKTERVGRDNKRYPRRIRIAKGQELFDFDRYERDLGRLIKDIGVIGQAYKCKNDPQYHAMQRVADEYWKLYRSWRKRLLKEAKDKAKLEGAA